QQRKMAKLLESYPPLPGTVYLPGGMPASGATALLGIPGEGAILGDRQFEHVTKSTLAKTPADGTFILPHVPNAHLYVVHNEGFAEVNLADAPSPISIQLAPWGKVEGTMIRQGKPVPHETVIIFNPSIRPSQGLTFSLDAFKKETDEQGRFVFPHLP